MIRKVNLMGKYSRTMSESLRMVSEVNNMDLMRKAADGAMQTMKMKDGKVKMDSFTASAIMQIYDKVNPKNKKTMENMLSTGKIADIMKLQKFAMSKTSGGTFRGNQGIKAEYVPEEINYDTLVEDLNEKEEVRQLKDPKKEMMVKSKDSGVFVIDKKDFKKYEKKGFFAVEEVDLDERIDPADIDMDATEDDIKSADKNIMMQMRKVQSLKGNYAVEFMNGKKQKIDPKIAMAVQSKYMNMRRPAEKEMFQAKISKSYKDMLSALKEGFASDAQRKAAFASGYKEKGKKKKEEVEEAKQVLAHGGKGKYKVVSDDGAIDVMFKGKSVGKGDYDRGAGSFFMTIKGEKGQKSFEDGQAIADYFAKNKITEGTWHKAKDMSGLKKLMKKPILLGKDGDGATAAIAPYIGDDELYDDLFDAGKKDGPKADARPLIKNAMQRLGIKEEVELDESEFSAMAYGKKDQRFIVKPRDIRGMAGKQDKFKMYVAKLDNRGNEKEIIKDLGTHISLDSAIKFAKNNKIIEDVELDEMKMTFGTKRIPAAMKKKGMDKVKTPGLAKDKSAGAYIGKKKTYKEDVLDEAKYDLYHKDFSTAMQHAYKMAKKLHGITVDPKEIDDKVASGPKKPSEGKTNSYRLEGDKGAIQVQVYNKGGSKPFELNFYKEEVERKSTLQRISQKIQERKNG